MFLRGKICGTAFLSFVFYFLSAAPETASIRIGSIDIPFSYEKRSESVLWIDWLSDSANYVFDPCIRRDTLIQVDDKHQEQVKVSATGGVVTLKYNLGNVKKSTLLPAIMNKFFIRDESELKLNKVVFLAFNETCDLIEISYDSEASVVRGLSRINELPVDTHLQIWYLNLKKYETEASGDNMWYLATMVLKEES